MVAIGQRTSRGGGGSCGGRRLQVDGVPGVPLGSVELEFHCD